MSYEDAGIQRSKIGQLPKDWFISIGWRLGYDYSFHNRDAILMVVVGTRYLAQHTQGRLVERIVNTGIP
jgi:hypothetical protein